MGIKQEKLRKPSLDRSNLVSVKEADEPTLLGGGSDLMTPGLLQQYQQKKSTLRVHLDPTATRVAYFLDLY